MNFLANENIPLTSVLYLRKKGFDIKSIGIEHPGISDKDIIHIAEKEERTILTFDKDYGELIFKHNYKPSKGVIFLRIEKYSPEEPGIIIEQLVSDESFQTERTLSVF